MKDLTKEQKKELEKIALEIEAEAIHMKVDYENNPSEHSGSVVIVNQESTLLKNEKEKLGTTMMVSSTQRVKKRLEEQEGEEKDD